MAKMTEIKLFEEKQVRSVWNDQEEQWYFSIVDVVSVLTDSSDPKQYLKKMRARDPELNVRWGTICHPPFDSDSRRQVLFNPGAKIRKRHGVRSA